MKPHESDSYSSRGWCTWKHLEKLKGLVGEARSTLHFWKYTVVGYPRNYPPVAESVVSLSCGELLRHD